MIPSFFKAHATVQEHATLNIGVRELLHKKMAKYEKARDHSRVHTSDITRKDFCAREFALCDLTNKKPAGQFIGTSLQATFDLGRSLQDLLNQSWGVDWCVGTWECLHCLKIFKFQKRPEQCDQCGHRYFRYKEEVFVHPLYKHSCSIDYLFLRPSIGKSVPLLEVVEVKTMVKDGFKVLQAPVAEHRVQTAIYLKTIEDSKDERTKCIKTSAGRVFYICKGFGCAAPDLKENGIKDAGFSPFKEYIVTRDKVMDKLVERYYEKAAQVELFRANGTLPPGYCATSLCKKAKYCPVRKECWGGEYGSVFGDDSYKEKKEV